MAAPSRIPGLVLVLVPTHGQDVRDVSRIAKMASRAVLAQGRTPLSPLLLYGSCLSMEELAEHLRKTTVQWARRASRILLCDVDNWVEDEPRLDPITYRVLLENEGGMLGFPRRNSHTSARVPVSKFILDPPGPQDTSEVILSRDAIKSLLQCNLTTGLTIG